MNNGLRAIHAAAIFFAISIRVDAATYEVGPNQPLPTPSHVPWETLNAGDTVRIHWRPNPYFDKWVVCRQGTEDKPIVIEGAPGPDGSLPIIDGKNAVTREQLNFWGEGRAVIKIGGANRPKDTTPKHIVIRNLEIRNGRQPFEFTGRNGKTKYDKHAAAIFIEKAEHVLISDCTIRDNGNGIMTSWHSRDLVVEYCYIHSNGVEKSGYEHNCYIGGIGAKFQFNRFGPLRDQCNGVNFKSRAARTVLRYNWIEGGKRCVNIVETKSKPVLEDPGYRETFVYGNVIIREDAAPNNQVVHYGGDLGDRDWYRKGTLHFYNNTVIANRTRSTALFLISSPDETVDSRNNIFFRPTGSGPMAVLVQDGSIELRNNWLSEGWRMKFTSFPDASALARNFSGVDPGFRSFVDSDFRLSANSFCVGKAGDLAEAAAVDHPLLREYRVHRESKVRSPNGTDLGAFGSSPVEGNPIDSHASKN